MKNYLLPLSLLASLAAQAKLQWIPPHIQDLKDIKKIQTGAGVLKSAKGTIMGAGVDSAPPKNWFNLSPVDGVQGVSAELAYATHGMPAPSADVIVAVIDSGVDVNHEDLQGKIWINDDEVANNGVDDDGNGYVDDVFGWNFIGGANGMGSVQVDPSLGNGIRLIKGDTAAQIDADSLEVTRELVRLRLLKERLEEVGGALSVEQAALLAEVEKEVTEASTNARNTLVRVEAMKARMEASAPLLRVAGVQITLEAVRAFETTDPVLVAARLDVLELLSGGFTEARLLRLQGAYRSRANFYYNTSFNPRGVVGDNYADQNQRVYGNNDVIGPDSSHGTHVAGIIAADRENTLGINGVAIRVKIMAVRVVPDGDERDKDVANGIRYAVDNGAKIINMSFGKAYSPYKRVVDEAVRYAEAKGVLLVHAAGNSSLDLDQENNFPNRFLGARQQAANWLEIGASAFQKGLDLPATFSNYGKHSVDVFAPGVDILSTTPDNKYDTFSGTSMASPAAAGVAALLWSHDETLKLEELRALMVDTSRRYPRLSVKRPGVASPVLFSNLSINGSILDANSAVSSLVQRRK